MIVNDVPIVSVTLVLHNSEEHLTKCLGALCPQLAAGFAELIVVDNASPDRSAEIVLEHAPEARVVRSETNLGFAAGANLAWPHVRGRYWMLLNPDVELRPAALRVLVEWMDRHPQAGVASAELDGADSGGLPASGRAFPSAWRTLLEASRLHRLLPQGLRGRILRGPYWRGGDQIDAGWVPGTAMLARVEAVRRVGLLDESFFLYGEDVEWCWRMHDAGWAVGVCSSARARHEGRTSAHASLEAEEVRQQGARGMMHAVRVARGPRRARRYARAMMLACAIDAWHPGRSAEGRGAAHTYLHSWRSVYRAEFR